MIKFGVENGVWTPFIFLIASVIDVKMISTGL